MHAPHGTFDYISNGRVIQLPRGEKIGCGCCRGPVSDRCACHMHGQHGAKVCSIHAGATRSQHGGALPERGNGNAQLLRIEGDPNG